MNEVVPKFLQPQPKPVIENRLYHRSHVPLWRGVVLLSDVQGWADNPRMEIEMKRWKGDFANADISQDDLYEMMRSTPHVRLKELAANIADNGLREPVVLTFDGRLLDGNRRFFAVRFAHKNTTDIAKKKTLESIPAFVLTENATQEQISNILVEENFSPSLKEEWPYYVKAEHVRRAKDDEGMSVRAIADKFGWTPSKVNDTLKIAEIINAFKSYATGDSHSDEGGLGLSVLEAEKVAADNYQFFNEAKKSLRKPLELDTDFAELFFKLVAQNNVAKFFSRFDEVRCAYEGYKHPSGKPIMEKGAPGGGKRVKALIDAKKHEIKDLESNEDKIAEFVAFLERLNASQMQAISDNALDGLRKSLTKLVQLVETAKMQK